MPNLSGSAHKVQQALDRFGLTFEVVELPASTRTAAEAAAAIGTSVAQIAKSLIFTAQHSSRPILVIASGINRVDEKKVETLLGEPVRKANAEFVRHQTGYAIGGVPPLGHARSPVVFIDQDLMQFKEIWAAAGTPNAVFRLAPSDLTRISGGTVADIA